MRYFPRLILALILLFVVQDHLWSQGYSGGWGTTTNPYIIANKADLKYLTGHGGDWGKHFVQTADIYLVASDFQSGGDFYNGGAGFSPIGNYVIALFTGSYDGYGHVIDGLVINSNTPYRGLFGHVAGSVANLGVTNASVASSRGVIGAVAGYVMASGSVTRCYSSGVITATGYLVDGTAGGVAGLSSGTITESYSTCTVTSPDQNSDFGGLVGSSSGTIKDSYARGPVGSSNTSWTGGLVGSSSGTILRSYSTGVVYGYNSFTVHGFVGYYTTAFKDTACFWDNQTSGQSGGGANASGQTTANMQTASTFTNAGWDFTNTWEIVGTSYPTLRALPADTIGPVVAAFTPADGDTLTDGAGTIMVLFNEIVSAHSVGSVRIYTGAGALVEQIAANDSRITISGRAVTIDPDSILADGAYYVQIDAGAFKDLSNNGFVGFTDNTTWNFVAADPAPMVQTVNPSDGGVVMHADTNFVVTFSETVVAQSGKTLSLYRIGTGLVEQIPAIDSRVTVSSATVTINPDSLPVDGSYYMLIDSAAFKDAASLSFAGIASDTGWNFTISDPAPTASSFTPADGTTLTVSPATLNLTFNEPVSAVAGKNITIYNENDAVMEQIPANDGRVSISGAVITIDPDTLLPNWGYYVQVDAGAFKDAGGRGVGGILDTTTWNFTVNESKLVSTTSATSVGTTSAQLNASINPENDTLAVRFFWGSSSGNYTDSINASPATVQGSIATNASATATGLAGGATYYYKVVAFNNDLYIEGNEKSFSTQSAVWGSTLEFKSANGTHAKTPAVVTTATDNFTIEAWVKWDGTNTGLTQLIISNGRLDHEGYSICLYPDTRIGILVNAVVWYISDSTLPTNSWSHLAAVRNSGVWSLYKDGHSLPIGAATATPNTPALNFFVGGESTEFYFNGQIDEVRASTVARYTSSFSPSSWPFDPDSSTAALYHFDEASGASASDVSGNGHHLTLFNSPAWTGRGYTNEPALSASTPGTAIDFPGTAAASNFVEVPNNPLLNPSDNFTVELWARPEGGAGTYRCPLGSENTEGGDEPQVGYYFYAAYDDTWHVWMGEGSDSWKVLFSSVPVTLNAWTHLALTFKSDTARFYVNGVLTNTSVVDSFKVNSTAPFRIGEIGEAPGYVQWNGKIDEVRVWHVARSEKQVREAMHRTVQSSETGLVAYFQMNEGSGTSVSGLLNGIIGSITGSPVWVASGVPAASGSSVSQTAFMTGTANLGTIAMTMTDGFDNAVDLTATKISGAPDSTTGIVGTALTDRYWAINSFGTTGTFAANLTFTVPSSFTMNGAGNASLYTVYHRSGNGEGAWTAAVNGASSLTDTTVTFNGVSSFSQFAIGTEDVLPVQMVGMRAEVVKKNSEVSSRKSEVRLSWNTATEVDNVGWEVERREARMQYGVGSKEKDGWMKVGFVEGAGTSTSSRVYSFTDAILNSEFLIPNSRLIYRLKQIDRSGSVTISQEVEVEIGSVPAEFSLAQNYPNPFNPTTTIRYGLPQNGKVRLAVFDLLGREVATLVDGEQLAGWKEVSWDASTTASGIYFYRLTAGELTQTRRLVLLR